MNTIDLIREYGQSLSGIPQPITNVISGGLGALLTIFLNGIFSTRRAILDELKSLSTAYIIAGDILNLALNLKEQHLQSLKTEYDELTEKYDEIRTINKGVLEASLKFFSLQSINFPTELLNKYIYEKLALGAEGILTTLTLERATQGLALSIRLRNVLCDEFQNKKFESFEHKLSVYLGLVYNDNVDERFRHNVEALSAQTDDCIFFAKHLSEIIYSAEEKIRLKKVYYFLPGRKSFRINWSQPERKGLFPPASNYSNWTGAFIKRLTFTQKMNKFHRKFICQIND